jgi:hypothetical protein
VTQKFMTGLALSGLLGLGMVVGTSQPGSARTSMMTTANKSIMINGHLFEGRWAYVEDRPFVSVSAFEHALGLPHRHDTRNWYLGAEGAPHGNVLQPGVESAAGKLPSVSYGGTMMVDLRAACKALHLRCHEDFETGTYYVSKRM